MAKCRPGIDALAGAELRLLRQGAVGLVTNHTGVDASGRPTLEALRSKGIVVRAMFAPEHGIDGAYRAGAAVAHSARAGMPIWSLFGEAKRPTPEMLAGIDVLAIDLQDVGARGYTHLNTVVEVLRAAAQHARPVVVLDRPNPSGGLVVEGPVAGGLPLRHALTIGEAALVLNEAAAVAVAKMDGWHRRWWYDETELAWIAPSPLLRSLTATVLYPGMVLLDGTSLSDGRGTGRPFEWAGAPGIDGVAWAVKLNALDLPGARFHAARATPTEGRFAGQPCGGVRISVITRLPFQSVTVALALIATARELAPREVRFDKGKFDRVAGSDRVRKALEKGQSAQAIADSLNDELDAFRKRREGVMLY